MKTKLLNKAGLEALQTKEGRLDLLRDVVLRVSTAFHPDEDVWLIVANNKKELKKAQKNAVRFAVEVMEEVFKIETSAPEKKVRARKPR